MWAGNILEGTKILDKSIAYLVTEGYAVNSWQGLVAASLKDLQGIVRFDGSNLDQ